MSSFGKYAFNRTKVELKQNIGAAVVGNGSVF